MKVLHLPSPVGGNSWGLARAEQLLGLESSVLVASQNWLEYAADIELGLERRSNLGKLLKSSTSFLSLRKRYDVFHFNAGASFIHAPHRGLDLIDLPFYPERAGLFATYNGCDARQKFPTIARTALSACHVEQCYHGLCEYGRYDQLRQHSIAKMARHVRHLWALNPDLLHFLPPEKSSFLPYAVLNENPAWHPAEVTRSRLRIVHAPTNRQAKGTAYILSAVERLRATHGDRFELRLVEGVQHSQAMRLYAESDLVIDQILIGWYGGFAVETMAMGKPVIARLAPEDLRFLPPDMAREATEAIIEAEPETIESVLRRCIEDRTFLAHRVQAAAAYARRWHHPRYVASITKAAYEAALCAE